MAQGFADLRGEISRYNGLDRCFEAIDARSDRFATKANLATLQEKIYQRFRSQSMAATSILTTVNPGMFTPWGAFSRSLARSHADVRLRVPILLFAPRILHYFPQVLPSLSCTLLLRALPTRPRWLAWAGSIVQLPLLP